MSTRSAISFFLLAFVFTVVLTACQTTKTQQIIDFGPSDTRTTIEGTIVDSLSGEPVDSVAVSYRGASRTLYTDAAGRFSLPDVPPGVYLFDLSKYGYHAKRDVAAVVSPGDSTVTVEATLLGMSLDMKCYGINADYHDDVNRFAEEDSNAVRLRMLDFFVRGNRAVMQPVITNNVNAPLFMPGNYGAYGNYDVTLVDADGNPIEFRHTNKEAEAPGLGTSRIYERGDVQVVVPRQSQRLETTEMEITESLSPGQAVYGKIRYDFSLDRELRPTPNSTFPEVTLDSLRFPIYDTLRVSGDLIVPDSLVMGVDTTIVRVLGTDTTITRGSEVLFSSEDTDTLTTRQALSLLRLKELPRELGPVELPPIDTTRPPLYIVERGNNVALDTLVTERGRLNDLISASWPKDSTDTRALRTRRRPVWRYDTPVPDDPARLDSLLTPLIVPDSVDVDSLLADSLLLAPLLPEPEPAPKAMGAGEAPQDDTAPSDTVAVDPMPTDTSRVESRVEEAPADTAGVDPAVPDTTDEADVMLDDAMEDPAADTTGAASETLRAPEAGPEPSAADTTKPRITIDSLRKTVNVDSLRDARRAELLRQTLQSDTARSISLEAVRAAVMVDSLERAYRGDSLVTIPPSADLFSLASTLDSLRALPELPRSKVGIHVPTEWTADSTRVFVVSTMLYRQPMEGILDTNLVADITSLTPQELVRGQRKLQQTVIQQIVLVPIGGYRDKYLDTWIQVQRDRLRDPYCDIFRLPLETEWRATTVQ